MLADGNHFLTAVTDLPVLPSIAYGVIAGIGSYIVINSVPWIIRRVSNGRITPATYGSAEPWVVPPGGVIPPWM